MILNTRDMEAVETVNGLHARLMVEPMYFNLGFSNTSKIFGRRVVLDKLLQALAHLPRQVGFMVWDIYRCRSCQGRLFEWMRVEVKKKYPGLTDTENYETASKFMSPPSQIGDAYCPPHLSGGAVDLTLFDVTTGNELNMGTPFDDCTERAHADFFDKYPPQLDEDRIIRDRRKMLSGAMQSAGFSVYDFEWWHFDFGNVFWSRKTGLPEAFGPLFGDHEMPEDIL